jgi:hypothetical protein
MLVSRRMSIALGAMCLALSVLASAAVAAGPATVTVRVEGASTTLLPSTQVTTTTEPVVKDGNPEHACTGTSAAGALQLATAGNWSGTWFTGFGYSVETIEGESHSFSSPAFWTIWLDNKPASAFCEAELSSGDSLLLFPECSGECPAGPSPLGIEAPAVAEVGQPVRVTVTSYANPSGAPSASDGATVAYEGTNAITDASGHATLTFARAGQAVVKVTAPDSIRTETTLCVHSANDGACGTQATPGTAGSAGGVTAGIGVTATPFKGPYALVPKLTGLIDGHTYTRAHAPRILSGSVLAHTTVSSISLTLRREYRHRCYAFDGLTTRFMRARCGKGKPFNVSGSGTFSYLLPFALPPGRYVLDIQASDAAGNHTTLARGTSRIVFYVR